MFSENSQPIAVLVDVTAKVVRMKWENLKKRMPMLPPDQAAFAATAYSYLTRRETGIFKLERDSAFATARHSYRQPESLWGDARPSVVANAVGATSSAIGIFVILGAISYFFSKINEIAAALITFVNHPDFFAMVLSFASLIALMAVLSRLTARLLQFLPQEALVMGSPLSWRFYQARSAIEARSERYTILAMMHQPDGDGAPAIPPATDPDIVGAEDDAVPIPPGIGEIVLSIDEDAISEIRSDLRRIRSLHLAVFWSSFGLFSVCVLAGLISGLVYGVKAAAVSGATTSVIGTFCYLSLRNARTASIALSLFQSYLAELRGRVAFAAKAVSAELQDALRQQAWLEFRSGMNNLWKQEAKARTSRR